MLEAAPAPAPTLATARRAGAPAPRAVLGVVAHCRSADAASSITACSGPPDRSPTRRAACSCSSARSDLRRRPGAAADADLRLALPAVEHEERLPPAMGFNWPLEGLIWIPPTIIVIVLAVFLWRDTHALDPYKPLASPLPPVEVQAVALDWKWLFIYPDEGVASVNELAFPADRPVRLTLTSDTVMQSFFVPAARRADLRHGRHDDAAQPRGGRARPLPWREHPVQRRSASRTRNSPCWRNRTTTTRPGSPAPARAAGPSIRPPTRRSPPARSSPSRSCSDRSRRTCSARSSPERSGPARRPRTSRP